MRPAITPEIFWAKFAELLHADILALGSSLGETYKPSPPWTKHMVKRKPDALLTRVGIALGFRVDHEKVDRIDVCYYGVDGALVAAIEHECGEYFIQNNTPYGKGWKHEFSKLVKLNVPLRVLIIYDPKCVSVVEERIATAVRECCQPDLLDIKSNSFLIIVGPYYDSFVNGTGLVDYAAYKFVDGQFMALESLPILNTQTRNP